MYFYQVHGHKAVWEDPVEWVRGTLPWPNAQQDQSRLFHLPPPSIGPPSEEKKKPPKDTPPPSILESDPLVRQKVYVEGRGGGLAPAKTFRHCFLKAKKMEREQKFIKIDTVFYI